MAGPTFEPPKKTTSRQVLLEPEFWDRLKVAAKFHAEVYKAMGASEGITRNTLISVFLGWALSAYWDDVGGEPTSKSDWAAKVQNYAKVLKARNAEK